ncbi:hypothetical protein EIP91_002963 [Steccherinum ochraceum]|uniref:Uncharacterized protein n=1 Tax=Steccherinum ochraceum TaxID=92696 RepID=A0A4R0RDQ8_9APHY|nr:hypothetical protein EIP91_002963 [Steccherinum ochraceum]
MKTERYYVDIVSTDGPIPEYEEQYAIEDSRYTTNSCWIPSEAGQAFRINISNLSADDIEARCFIDGRLLTRILVPSNVADYADGVHVTDSAVRPFVFSDVTVIDDENTLVAATYNPEKLGMIEVKCTSTASSYGKSTAGIADSFREVAAVPSIFCADALMMDKPEQPRARFIYRYRPRSLLQAEGLIPHDYVDEDRNPRKRSRTQSPLTDESDSQDTKRYKHDQSPILYDSIEDIWSTSLLLKPAFLGDQDLNVGLVDEELESLRSQRDVLAEQLKGVDTKILEVKSRRSSRSYEPSPVGSKKDCVSIHQLPNTDHSTFGLA